MNVIVGIVLGWFGFNALVGAAWVWLTRNNPDRPLDFHERNELD